MLLDVIVGCYVINCTITIDKPHYLIRERKVYEGFYPVQLRLWALAGSYRPQNGTERIEQTEERVKPVYCQCTGCVHKYYL